MLSRGKRPEVTHGTTEHSTSILRKLFTAHELLYAELLCYTTTTNCSAESAQKVDIVTVLLHKQSMWVSEGHRDTIYTG